MTELVVLSVAEETVLVECEHRIERGLKTFVEVGTALATIRDNRLYRVEFGTFEDYCQDRWGFTRQRAQQITAAADLVSTIVATGLPAPTNEGQARELARLPEPERADIWRETVERTDGKPTAAAIRDAYERTQTPAITPEPGSADVDVAEPGHDFNEQRKANRRPLADAFRDAAYDLVKVAERIDRLVTDDRFPRNAEQVGRTCRADLLRAGDLLAAAVSRVPNATKEPTE